MSEDDDKITGPQRAALEKLAPVLVEFLDAFRKKYPVEDIGHVLRSLVYFGDAGDLLPEGLSQSQWERIRADFKIWVQAGFRAG